jgi:hypothetical protein
MESPSLTHMETCFFLHGQALSHGREELHIICGDPNSLMEIPLTHSLTWRLVSSCMDKHFPLERIITHNVVLSIRLLWTVVIIIALNNIGLFPLGCYDRSYTIIALNNIGLFPLGCYDRSYTTICLDHNSWMESAPLPMETCFLLHLQALSMGELQLGSKFVQVINVRIISYGRNFLGKLKATHVSPLQNDKCQFF